MSAKTPSPSIIAQYQELAGRIKDIKIFEGEITPELLRLREKMQKMEQEYAIPSEIQFAVRV